MQGISDPETFQLSEIVEKSSKSGIFTNKRLLMIKDGFLYYFSTVPSDYKTHEPNIMSSLKEFPKCSIEIRSIQNIKLESAKSSTLIITFYDRDMIDREDIRKSLSSKNYNHPVKQNASDQQEEWKFIFATVMKCRLWYGSLVKLKQYFVKNQDKFDKFTQYMANFDPQIRNSLPQFSPNNASNINRNSTPLTDSPTKPASNSNNLPSFIQNIENTSSSSKYKMEKESGIFAIQESSEEYDEEFTPKNSHNGKLQEKKAAVKEQKKVQEKVEVKEVVAIDSVGTTNNAEKKEEPPAIKISQPKKSEPQKEKEIDQQLFQHFQEQVIKQQIQTPKKSEHVIIKPTTSFIVDQKQPEKQNPPKTNQLQQIQQIFQQQQKRYAQQQAALFSKQLQLKQELIKKMADQLQSNKKAKQELQERIREETLRREEQQRMRIILEREKKEEEEYRRLKQSIKSQHFVSDIKENKEIVVRQESIQTQYERDFIEVIQGNFKQTTKNSRYSFKSDLSLNHASIQRETLNLFRNTISYISEVKVDTHNSQIQHYDYFWEIGQLYKSSNVKERIAKELQFAEFIRKASRKASDMVTHYIDLNRPKQSLKIDRNLFEIQIVCDRGRVIRTEGSQRLIYPNQNHQRLKRAFKIYNKLNDIIISILKKKPTFPLRVPFACLIEYKGYTALARIIPPLKENTINSQYLKNLGPSIPTYNLVLNDFQSHGATFTLLQPTLYFKATKEDQTSIVRFPQKNNDFLSLNRKANISISSKKLFEESKEIQNNSKQRLELAQKITLCRQLKKIMKANTPYLQDNKQFQFFDDFLKNPSIFMDEIIETTDHKITGLLLYYIQKMLGIRLKAKFTDKNSFPQYFAISVKRMFGLQSLDVSNFSENYQRYLFQQKYELAQKSLSYFKQLEEDYAQTLMKEVILHINQNQFSESIEKLEMAEEMMSVHDPRRLKIIQLRSQCYEAAGDVGNALASLKSLLQETQYTYGKNSKLVQIYFMIAGLLSRQKLIPQLIQVYRKIIQENPDFRSKVLIDFSSNLLYQDTDPHILLDFLQKELPESIDQNHPEIQHLLGSLYLKVKNKPKALGYFTNLINNILNQGKRSDKLYEIFTKIMECCSSVKEKKTIHRQIHSKMNALNFSKDDESQGINTYSSCIICESFLESQRDNLIVFLQYSKKPAALRLLQWAWLDSILKRAAKGQHVSQEQKAILIGSIDVNAFTQHLILLNNPNFI